MRGAVPTVSQSGGGKNPAGPGAAQLRALPAAGCAGQRGRSALAAGKRKRLRLPDRRHVEKRPAFFAV